jgi:hypothetical protein
MCGAPDADQRPETGPLLALPLPAGVVVCLCCGELPITGAVKTVAEGHTRSTRHPTMFRSIVQNGENP